MDQIRIESLEVFAKHGVFPEENILGQKFIVSAVLYTNTRIAGKTDDLTQSIHYGEVSQFIERFLKEHTFLLIERVAESLAEALLLHVEHLEKIKLEVKKPWAPVGLPLQYVSVCITRQWHTAYIALGSNIGEKADYLDGAVQALRNAAGCKVEACSTWFLTAPYGMVEQQDFLNGCLKLRTLLTPKELLERLHEIEALAGRERVIRWGPRTLDLDIIFYDDIILGTETLCIPHVDMHRRDFVLKPLHEIAPFMHHPVMGKTVQQLLQELESNS